MTAQSIRFTLEAAKQQMSLAQDLGLACLEQAEAGDTGLAAETLRKARAAADRATEAAARAMAGLEAMLGEPQARLL